MENLVNKLLLANGSNLILHFNKWAEEKAYHGVGDAYKKKWIANILPFELLSKNLKTIIEMVMTLSEGEIYKSFPDNIDTPNYGDNWGRNANYIEINNRAIASMERNLCRDGILSAIKILPAIPPSAKSWANCIILSQIYPNIFGDGYNKLANEENSIYGMKLNAGYSKNIVAEKFLQKISADEQFKAFNYLAHFRGLKTGFRMIISEDQLKIAHENQDDENFRWTNQEHVELFINSCVNLINLGFEAIFFDSAKHIGGYDMNNYTGVGALPEYYQMQYVLDEIRSRSKNTHLSFIGEKSSEDFERYRLMGLNAGTAFVPVDDFSTVKYWSDKQKYLRNFAAGVEVSNDNDEGGRSFEERLNRINSCLFGFTLASDKLPSFMQMEDLFPLRYDTNTHLLMMANPSYSTDETPQSHWENLFTKEDGRNYNHQVGEIFAHALNL
ncbi:MAG: hypothetical protein MJ229_04345 [bacterium]|nr:hypothetical protein [bacterium]